MAAGSAAVLTNFIINLVVCIICFIIFSFLRVSKFAKRYFAPRRFAKDIALKPRRLPNSLVGWFWPLFAYTEPEIIDETGLDTAIYLRFLDFGVRLFFIASIWCLIGVLTVNLTSHEINNLLTEQAAAEADPNAPKKEYKFTDFDKYSLSNVEPKSQKMWVHLGSVYFVVLTTLTLLWIYSKDAVLLRIMFLGNSKRGGPTNTVFVTDIPGIAQKVKEEQRIANEKAKAQAKADKAAKKAQAKEMKDKPEHGDHLDPEAQNPLHRGLGLTKADNSTPARSNASEDNMLYSAPPPPADAALPVSTPPGAPGSPDVPLVHDVAGVDAGQNSQRTNKKFDYNLKDKSLDPIYTANEKLKAGMPPKALVEEEFRLTYTPQQVAAVNMVHDQKALAPLVAEYDQVQQKLEDYLDEVNLKLRLRRPIEQKMVTIRPGGLGEWGKRYAPVKWHGFKKVDALEYWTARLAELKRLIPIEQQKALAAVAPSAFVTFNTRAAQCTGATALHTHDETCWKTTNAAAPFELYWNNLSWTTPQRSTSSTLMWVLFWLMACFFMIPITAIQGLIDVPKLATVPVLGMIVNWPVIKQLLEAIVPGLALKIFLALVPMILAYMMKFSGAVSENEIDFGVVQRYFLFQIVLVFFGTVIASSFFNQLQQWIKDPGSVISVLGTSIPSASTFFITFILISGLGAKPIGLLRVVGLVLFWIFTKFAGSPRARERLWRLQYTNLGATVSDHSMTILLGLVFSCINPIVCPAALCYFLITTITERYQNLYVFRRHYESGGRLWRTFFNQVMIGVYIMELTMLGLLGIKKFPYTVLLIPLILGTIAFHITCMSLFSRPWSITSLHDAAVLDVRDCEENVREPLLQNNPEMAAAKGAAYETPDKHTDSARVSEMGSPSPRDSISMPVPPMKGMELGAPSSAHSSANEGGARIPHISEEEKAEIAEMYKSPVFKVHLEDVERLEGEVRAMKERIEVDNQRREAIQKAHEAEGKKGKAPIDDDVPDAEGGKDPFHEESDEEL